jgi:hypothetical protein
MVVMAIIALILNLNEHRFKDQICAHGVIIKHLIP